MVDAKFIFLSDLSGYLKCPFLIELTSKNISDIIMHFALFTVYFKNKMDSTVQIVQLTNKFGK